MILWGHGLGMGWMMVSWLVWLVIIVVVVWIITTRTIGASTGMGESPETILKRRYAKGEIDREEYERRLSDIRK
jgi:putative membrane protein